MSARRELNRELIVLEIDKLTQDLRELRETVQCDVPEVDVYTSWFKRIEVRIKALSAELSIFIER